MFASRGVQDRARKLGQAVDALKTSLGSVFPGAFPGELESPLKDALTGVQDAAETLRRLSRSFLTWTGKAERLSFDVPTLLLFVHDRIRECRAHDLRGVRAGQRQSFGGTAGSEHNETPRSYGPAPLI